MYSISPNERSPRATLTLPRGATDISLTGYRAPLHMSSTNAVAVVNTELGILVGIPIGFYSYTV